MYVEPFPATGLKYLVAQVGGRPLWSHDGTELFLYRRLFVSVRFP